MGLKRKSEAAGAADRLAWRNGKAQRRVSHMHQVCPTDLWLAGEDRERAREKGRLAGKGWGDCC